MSQIQNQNQDTEDSIRILIDVSSKKDHNQKVHIEGNQGTIIDVLVQLYEHPGNEDLAELFFLATEEYYNKYPDKRPII